MAETPQHMAGKDIGCRFMGAFFGPRHRPPPPMPPMLEASKEHRQTHNSGNHNSKKPPRIHTRSEMVYTGFPKPPPKTKTKTKTKTPPHPPRTVVKKPPTVVKKPPTVVKRNPTVDNSTYDSVTKSALYTVSQVTNISYTKQLRKEPSFTSSDLSLRISVRGKPNSVGSGNLKKKTTESTKSYYNGNNVLGNIYGNGIQPVKKPDPERFKNMGNEKYKQGLFDEAIAMYTEAIGIDSTVASYYSNRSAALIGLGKLIDAILDCKIAIRIDPSYHRAHYRLGSLYLRFGEVDKALCHYKCSGEKAESHDIAKAQALKAQLVTCFDARKAKDWNGLLKESRFAYSLGADSSLQVFAMQTEALLYLHRHDEAYTGFQNAPVVEVNTAIQLFGSKVTSNFLTVQAQVYLASGRFEEAVSVAFRASELDPSEEVFSVARKTRALAKARANGNKIFKASQFYEACNTYSEGLEHEPNNSVLLCNRAACRYKLGLFEKAVEDCTKALYLRPSYAKARLRRAQCNAKLERWEAAIQDYDVLNLETRGDEEVEREFTEARMQLEKKYNEDEKSVKASDSFNKEEFGGFFITV